MEMNNKIALRAIVVILAVLLVLVIAITVREGTLPQLQDDLPQDATQASTLPEEPLWNLGDGLYLMDAYNVSGTFIEDGSDVQVERVGAIKVENRSEKTLQLADIFLIVDGSQYVFRLTTLPPGASATIQEAQKQTLGTLGKEFEVVTENVIFFQEEPTLHPDVFSLITGMYSIEITNNSGNDIAGPIYIYYKTVESNGYQGGITYRVQVPDLKAGQTYQAYAGHFYDENSQVMFIDYAQ